MKLFFLSFLLVFSLLRGEPLEVLVTLAPYQFVLEQIGGEEVKVTVLVPPGVSGHTFEPSPKEMIQVSGASIWFRMGEPFEEKILPVLKSHNPGLVIVDLREGISLIYDQGGCLHCQGAHSEDLHYWLSPKNLKIQAVNIENQLKKLAPEKSFFLKNFLTMLDDVERKVVSLTENPKIRTVLVSHPAYAYFCRDFGFRQLSIEVEGKDPTTKQLVRIIQEAKAAGIRKVLIQPQYGAKGARLIAQDLGAALIILDPYAKDLFSSLVEIAREFGS